MVRRKDMSKSCRIYLRLTMEQKSALQKIAKKQNYKSLTEYIISTCMNSETNNIDKIKRENTRLKVMLNNEKYKNKMIYGDGNHVSDNSK